MKLKYWTGFSKRKNSTKIPTATGTEIDVWWKEDTSIDSPSVVLASNTFNIDYCYINDWGKYYFVSAIQTLTNGEVQYDLVEDTLATNKTAIGNTVAHIAYSSTGYNVNYVDPRIASKGNKTITTTFSDIGFNSTGCYVLSVVNDESAGRYGAVTYYVVETYALYQLIKWMMKPDFMNTIEQYFTGKATDFIQSCKWIPIKFADALEFCGTLQSTLYVGETAIADYSTAPITPVIISHYPVTDPVRELKNSQGYVTSSVAIGNKFLDFRDCQPYTSASLYLPGFGMTDININDFYDSLNVNINTLFDITTGDVTYRILDDNNQLLKTISFNASADVSLTQITTNTSGALAGIGGMVGGAAGVGLSIATGNALGAATAGIGIIASASATILSANQRSASFKGTNNGRSAFYNTNAILTLVQAETEDPDNANYIARFGRPVAETHAINNHSGYVQCENASVSITGDNWERDEINSYLNSGFYYE